MPIWCGMHEYLQASYWELLSVLWAKQPPNTCPYEEVRLIFYKHNLSTVALSPQKKNWLYTRCIYYLLTKSEVITGKSQTRACYSKAEVSDFSAMIERTRLISCLLYGLFIMDLSLLSIKTNNWPADNFLKTLQWVVYLSPRYSQVTLVRRCSFWQLSIDYTITWISTRMSTIKLNTDSICLGHLASNARSLQENSQSERACYCSHIIKKHILLSGILLTCKCLTHSTRRTGLLSPKNCDILTL